MISRRGAGTARRRQPKIEPHTSSLVRLTDAERRRAHMVASVLLDYPDDARQESFGVVAQALATLPAAIAEPFNRFLEASRALGPRELTIHYTSTFDQKRKCSPYLTYYAAGDTRKRGMALVRFVEAYRAAGWEVNDGELPDYLPTVLEFSALSDSPIAQQLLASHREGIEVLRAALENVESPYSHVLDAICYSLPKIDDATRERYLKLVAEGPPVETVGLTFLGTLAPFAPRGEAREEVNA